DQVVEVSRQMQGPPWLHVRRIESRRQRLLPLPLQVGAQGIGRGQPRSESALESQQRAVERQVSQRQGLLLQTGRQLQRGDLLLVAIEFEERIAQGDRAQVDLHRQGQDACQG